MDEVTAVRYRCVGCKRTFTHYPPGVDRNGCSVRLGALMSLIWALGMSHRSVAHLLSGLERPVFRICNWRAMQLGWQGGGARHERVRYRQNASDGH